MILSYYILFIELLPILIVVLEHPKKFQNDEHKIILKVNQYQEILSKIILEVGEGEK